MNRVVEVPHLRILKIHYRLRERLPLWVVYTPQTAEYTGVWVARMHVMLPEPRPTRFTVTADSLQQLRSLLPPKLLNIGRSEQDAPVIYEAWV